MPGLPATICAAIAELGIVRGDMLILPSATSIANRLGIIASGLVAIGKRVQITSAEEVLSRATGCEVVPVNGFIVDLSGIDQAPRPAPELPESRLGDLGDPAQRQALANEIVDKTVPQESLAFIQQFVGALASSMSEEAANLRPEIPGGDAGSGTFAG